jgi:hypothetical protein
MRTPKSMLAAAAVAAAVALLLRTVWVSLGVLDGPAHS